MNIYNPIPRTKKWLQKFWLWFTGEVYNQISLEASKPLMRYSNGSCQYMISKLSKTIDPCWQEEPVHYFIWIYILGEEEEDFFRFKHNTHLYWCFKNTLAVIKACILQLFSYLKSSSFVSYWFCVQMKITAKNIAH